MATILHISDVHFGWPSIPEAVEAIHAFEERLGPDVVACSGDLVQRGDFSVQFKQARAFLDRFRAPWITVPGNHDIPLWNPLRRMLRPFGNYRRYIHSELNPAWEADGVVIAGINTARPWLVDLGHVGRRQLERTREVFAAADPEALRVVVMHHPLVATRRDGLFRHHVRGHKRALKALGEAGADLVLSGHNHFPFTRELEGEEEHHTMVMVQSGTSASSRFRPHTGCVENVVNVIRRDGDGHVTIEHHHLRSDGFEEVHTQRFRLKRAKFCLRTPQA